MSKIALSSLIAWIMICLCYTRFYKALAAQGISRKDLDLRSWFQPYTAWICIFFFNVVLFFNGFEAFIHSFSVSGFFASYITLPVVALSFGGYRLYSSRAGKKVGLTNLKEINLGNGPIGALMGTKYELQRSRV
jgi:amino acid transporter